MEVFLVACLGIGAIVLAMVLYFRWVAWSQGLCVKCHHRKSRHDNVGCNAYQCLCMRPNG